METDLIKPCSNCPFRTDCRAGWLGEERAEVIIGTLLNDGTFSCHKTTGTEGKGKKKQHCAGAFILLEKLHRPNQWMRWMERLGFYKREKLDMSASVFDEPGDFIDHHTQDEK